MSKRTSGLPRHPNDHYDTPTEAIKPLLPLLENEGPVFAEPCLGSGNITLVLKRGGFLCGYAGDIQTGQDVLEWTNPEKVDFVCTNPPWDRSRALTNRIVDHLVCLGIPAWLLLPTDWLANQNSAPWLPHISDILFLGRVRWIAGTTNGGMENSCWIRFNQGHRGGAKLHGQRKRIP